MTSQRMIERAMKLPPKFKLIKDNQRTLLCKHRDSKGALVPCLVRFRVKEIEPGIYTRVCGKCGQPSFFQLYVAEVRSNGELPLLRFKWLTKQEADSIESAFVADAIDIGLCRNLPTESPTE